jgi:hypothetical protein
MNVTPPEKPLRRIRFLFLALAILSLWQLIRRPRKPAAPSWSADSAGDPSRGTKPEADHPEPEPKTEPAAEAASSTNVLPLPVASSGHDPTPHLTPSDLRYAVKWVDSSEGEDTPHEKRDLTLQQAQREAGWLARHNRRFYPGELGDRSPFSRLQVWLQCLCGRDVVDLREPHTIPGEARTCPYSDSGQTSAPDVMLASR